MKFRMKNIYTCTKNHKNMDITDDLKRLVMYSLIAIPFESKFHNRKINSIFL